MENLIYILPVFGVVGLLYMLYLKAWVQKQDAGDEKMQKLAGYIKEGAMAFLKAEYRMLAIFVVIAGILLGVVSMVVETTHWFIVIAFVIGAAFSKTDKLIEVHRGAQYIDLKTFNKKTLNHH